MSSEFQVFASDPARLGRAPRCVAAADDHPVPSDCPAEITVRSRGTLNRIAACCGVTVRDLRLADDRIRPRELQAGQTLYIPDPFPRVAERRPDGLHGTAGQKVVTDDRPTAIYLPRRPREDRRIRISATGFPPRTEAEIGFLRSGGRYVPVRDETTDRRGALETAVWLPDAFEDGTTAANS